MPGVAAMSAKSGGPLLGPPSRAARNCRRGYFQSDQPYRVFPLCEAPNAFRRMIRAGTVPLSRPRPKFDSCNALKSLQKRPRLPSAHSHPGVCYGRGPARKIGLSAPQWISAEARGLAAPTRALMRVTHENTSFPTQSRTGMAGTVQLVFGQGVWNLVERKSNEARTRRVGPLQPNTSCEELT